MTVVVGKIPLKRIDGIQASSEYYNIEHFDQPGFFRGRSAADRRPRRSGGLAPRAPSYKKVQ